MSLKVFAQLNMDPNDPNSLFCHFAIAMAGKKTQGRTGGGAVLVDGVYTPAVGPVEGNGMAQFGFPAGILIQGPVFGPHVGGTDTIQFAADRGALEPYGMPKGATATAGDYFVATYLLGGLNDGRSILQIAYEGNMPFEPKPPGPIFPPPPPLIPPTTGPSEALAAFKDAIFNLAALEQKSLPATGGGKWVAESRRFLAQLQAMSKP